MIVSEQAPRSNGNVWPIAGHQVAVEQLRRAVSSSRVGHAYLITGPEHVGRGRLARLFAQALVCTAEPSKRPCGECAACRRAVREAHPDITYLNLETQAMAAGSKESKNTRISIDTIRELRGSIALRPLESQWRVAIIEDVDRFSDSAYDALLKTLEEPPPFVVMVLVAIDADAVPETIRSRCHPLPLEPLPEQEVRQVLEERGIGADLSAAIAARTRGRIGEAIALADDPEELARRSEAIQATLELFRQPLLAIGAARRLSDTYRRGNRPQVEEQLDLMVSLWRDLLLLKSDPNARITNADVRDTLGQLASNWPLEEILRALTATSQAMADLDANAQSRLVLDAMVAQWPARP
ncbi:MAG TPA: DNA polymerase III subunit [Thermomicrobiaceae bacterium]|nr:DNA polymerase III subunit [Thermomicrobiaceae bacterium]